MSSLQDAAFWARWTFTAFMVVWAFLLYAVMVGNANYGQRRWWNMMLPVVCVWAASPGLLTFLGAVLERRSVIDLLDPSIGSWAYLGGDIFIFPLLVSAGTAGWHLLHPRLYRIFGSWQWFVVSLAVGAIAAAAFRLEAVELARQAGVTWPIESLTKIAHDFCAYLALAAIANYMFWPMLLNAYWRGPDQSKRMAVALVMLSCLVGFLYLGYLDSMRGLDVIKLHPVPWRW